jgi:hypothetical protein
LKNEQDIVVPAATQAGGCTAWPVAGPAVTATSSGMLAQARVTLEEYEFAKKPAKVLFLLKVSS